MSFYTGQTVMSKRTGLNYIVSSRDEDTLDGQEVYLVRNDVTGSVFPIIGTELVGWDE